MTITKRRRGAAARLGVAAVCVNFHAFAADPIVPPRQAPPSPAFSEPVPPNSPGPGTAGTPVQGGFAAPAQVTSPALEAAATALTEASNKLQAAAAQLEAANAPTRDGLLLKGRLPWNGAFFSISEKQKRAIVSASIPLQDGVWTLNWTASAPLDEETRKVALLDPTELIPFRIGFAIEYNAMTGALQRALERGDTKAQSIGCRAFWKSSEGTKNPTTGRFPGCPDSDEYRRWDAAQKDAASARPDGLLGSSVPTGVLWNLGLQVNAAYDRTTVFRDDLAEGPDEESTYEVDADVAFTHYPSTWLALPLRAGATFSDRIRASTILRCQAVESSEPSISGQSCNDVQWLTRDPDPEATAHVELAAVVVPPGMLGDVQGGFEVRDRLEGLGGTALNRLSLGVFVSPTSGPVVSRFGVALEYRTALDDAPGLFESGDSWLVPLVLVGASL